MSTKPSTPLKTHHVALKASDIERSLRFYTEGLGMTLLMRWGEGDSSAAMLDIGDGSRIELFAGGAGSPPDENTAGCFPHFAFEVDNPDEWYDRAIAYGATGKYPPSDMYLTTSAEPLDIRVAFVTGPDGEMLEFFHNK